MHYPLAMKRYWFGATIPTSSFPSLRMLKHEKLQFEAEKEARAANATFAADSPCVEHRSSPGKAERREETGILTLRMQGDVVGDEEALARYPRTVGSAVWRSLPLDVPQEGEGEGEKQNARSRRYLAEVTDEAPGISDEKWIGLFSFFLYREGTTSKTVRCVQRCQVLIQVRLALLRESILVVTADRAPPKRS
jgi:hypothetical protein